MDRAALDLARKYNIPILGWCPKNGWAEDMPEAPGIRALFPELKETPSEDVAQRTRWNVRDSHATLIINPRLSRFSYELTLNIGGPRASECPEAYKKTIKIMETVIQVVNHLEPKV